MYPQDLQQFQQQVYDSINLFHFPSCSHKMNILRDRKGKTRNSSGSLATLRRRLMLRRRRTSKSPDHSKHLRDLVSGWSIGEISALCEQYEALSALKVTRRVHFYRGVLKWESLLLIWHNFDYARGKIT